MPIRFRCAYCGQLMGIARRKAGTVVSCPKCSGQVVVPAASEPGASVTPRPSVTPRHAPGGQSAPAADFNFADVEVVPPEQSPGSDEFLEVVPLTGPSPISGIFLSTMHLIIAGVLLFLLLVGAFFLGWFLRGR